MRKSLSLLLTASLVLSSTVFVASRSGAPAPEEAAILGPHLMEPNPDVYSRLPFRQSPPILGSTGRTRAPPTNDVLVLLIEFTDVAHNSAHDVPYVTNLMNGNSPGDLRHYYREVSSYANYTIMATVGGGTWFDSAYPMRYYGENSVTGVDDYNGPIYRLVREAVTLADSSVDFSQFDADSDGVVDHLIVMHAGNGEESSGSQNDIWSHRWAVVNPNLVVDGVRVYSYTMVAESSPIGVIAHEFGHDLGLPDLYDTDGSSIGAGVWDIMATGSWLGLPRGSSPAHMSAWCKAKLGWIDPVEVVAHQYSMQIPEVEVSPFAVKLAIRNSGDGEYFLLENREKVGYDARLPGEGLLIWHIDESATTNDNDAHRLVGLVEADPANGDSPDDAGDPWENTASGFTPDSVPNSNGYGNVRTGWKVRNISPAGTVMTADISKEVDDDMAVVEVRNTRSVAVNATVTIGVEVANLGGRNQTGTSVSLAIFRGGHAAGQKVYNTSRLLSLPSKSYVNFTWSYTPQIQGRYMIEVGASLPNDEIPENDRRLTHFNAMSSFFYDDVEAGNKGWTASPTGELYQWNIVQAGLLQGDAMSPSHSWHFGYVDGLLNVSSLYFLESGDVSYRAGPLYLSFFQRYELAVKGDVLVNETDEAYVRVSFNGGPWIQVPGGRFNEVQPEWALFYSDLTGIAPASGTMRVRFECTVGRMPRDGGWWIDDIFVSPYTFGPAVGILPVISEQAVNPGDKASIIFKVVNVGDDFDTFHITVSSDTSWTIGLSINASERKQPELVNITLDPDDEVIATLMIQTPSDAVRGSEGKFTITARSDTRATARDSFDATVTINDPLGLARLGRYLLLFVVVFIVLVAIALVIDHIKRQRGIR